MRKRFFLTKIFFRLNVASSKRQNATRHNPVSLVLIHTPRCKGHDKLDVNHATE